MRGDGLAIMLPPGLGLVRGDGLVRGAGLAVVEVVPALDVAPVVVPVDPLMAPVVPVIPGLGLGLAVVVVPDRRREVFLGAEAGVSA
jgi:hypothetical protein